MKNHQALFEAYFLKKLNRFIDITDHKGSMGRCKIQGFPITKLIKVLLCAFFAVPEERVFIRLIIIELAKCVPCLDGNFIELMTFYSLCFS